VNPGRHTALDGVRPGTLDRTQSISPARGRHRPRPPRRECWRAAGIAVKARGRIDRFEVVYFSAEQSIVGVSGFARSVQGGRLSRLSERGRVMHDRLVADQPARRPDHRTPSGRDRGSPAPTEAEHAAKRRLRWADDGDNEQDMIPRAQRRLVWRRHRLVEQVRSCVVRSIGISTLCRLGVCRIGSARALIGAHRWFEHSVRFGAG
jgi:hypothetical protein